MKKIIVALLLLSPLALCRSAAAAPEMAAYIGAIEGNVQVLVEGMEPWIDAKIGQQLPAGSQVRTAPAASTVIALNDGTKVRLGPNSDFHLEAVSRSKVSLFMKLGKIDCWVKKLAGRAFQVASPVAVASVRGTVFDVDVVSEKSTSIDVFSGNVAVGDSLGHVTMVGAGQRFGVGAGGGGKPGPLPSNITAPGEPSVSPQLAALLGAIAAPVTGTPGSNQAGELSTLLPPPSPPPNPAQNLLINQQIAPAPCVSKNLSFSTPCP